VYSNASLSGEERVTRRAFIRSRCDNDPRPFNDLPKAYWHGTVLPYGVSEIIFKHDNILVRFPGPRHRGRPRTPCAAGRGYLTRIITNAIVPLTHTHTCTHTNGRAHMHVDLISDAFFTDALRPPISRPQNGRRDRRFVNFFLFIYFFFTARRSRPRTAHTSSAASV